jgi:hypothetical protein
MAAHRSSLIYSHNKSHMRQSETELAISLALVDVGSTG